MVFTEQGWLIPYQSYMTSHLVNNPHLFSFGQKIREGVCAVATLFLPRLQSFNFLVPPGLWLLVPLIKRQYLLSLSLPPPPGGEVTPIQKVMPKKEDLETSEGFFSRFPTSTSILLKWGIPRNSVPVT